MWGTIKKISVDGNYNGFLSVLSVNLSDVHRPMNLTQILNKTRIKDLDPLRFAVLVKIYSMWYRPALLGDALETKAKRAELIGTKTCL